MGTQGTHEGVREGLVLDAGALIGLERGNPVIAVILKEANELGVKMVIPAAALAQAWRGGPRSARLANLVAGSDVDALDEGRAKEIGVRLGARSATDVADAHVVCCAIAHRAAVATSDREDIEALAEPSERLQLIVV